ncbi:unnamed protein product, partial [Meganyctiphanes norvegica]
CMKAFSHNYQLIRHQSSHTTDKPYQCRQCNKAFSQNGHLLSHLKLSFRCSILDKDFTQKYDILSHTRIHTGEIPYQCSNSEKVISNGNLIRHLWTEVGEKHQSSQGDKAFSHNINLIDHNTFTSSVKPSKSTQEQTKLSNTIIPYIVPFSNPIPKTQMTAYLNNNQNNTSTKELQLSSGFKHLHQIYSPPPTFASLREPEIYCKSGHSDSPKSDHTDVPLDLVLNPNKKYLTNNTGTEKSHILPYRPWELTPTQRP